MEYVGLSLELKRKAKYWLNSRYWREEKILMMAGVEKGIVSLIYGVTTEAAATGEADSGLADAFRAYDRLSATDYGTVLVFRTLVRSLPPDDLEKFEGFMEGRYLKKLAREIKGKGKGKGKGRRVKAGSRFVMKAATQGIVGVLARVVVDKAFDASTASEPCERAAGVVGLLLVMAGMVVHHRKPGLAKAMVKFGVMAIAFSMLVPMVTALSLSPIMAWVFGVLAASIVVVTAALC